MKLTGLPPAAVWAMRADEAISMLAARKRLMPKTPGPSPMPVPQMNRGMFRKPGSISFGSLEELRAILPRGKEQ